MGKEEIKIRLTWPSDMDPSTKVHRVKTGYNKKHVKKEIEDALLEAEDENADLDWP